MYHLRCDVCGHEAFYHEFDAEYQPSNLCRQTAGELYAAECQRLAEALDLQHPPVEPWLIPWLQALASSPNDTNRKAAHALLHLLAVRER